MDLLVQIYTDGMNRLIEEEHSLHKMRHTCEQHLYSIWVLACEENGIDIVEALVERIRFVTLHGN